MSESNDRDRLVPFSSKLAFGVGQFAEGLKNTAFGLFVLFYYADQVGLAEIYRDILSLHQQYGEAWRPAPLLKRLAEEGGSFAAWDAARQELTRRTPGTEDAATRREAAH